MSEIVTVYQSSDENSCVQEVIFPIGISYNR